MAIGSLIAVFLAIAIGCVAQAVTGIGLGLVSSAILIMVIGREDTVVLLSLMSLPSLVAVLWKNRQGILWTPALVMTLPAIAMIPVLQIILSSVDDAPLALLAGVLVVVSLIMLQRGLRARSLSGLIGASAAGFLSSVMHMVGGIGSPAVALYSLNAGWDPLHSRGTLQVYFTSLCLVSAVSIGWPHGDGSLFITAIAAMIIGTVAGMVLASRVSEKSALIATKALAALGGVLLIGYGAIGIAS